MATQTHPYLVITDGTTTVTIQDGSGGATNYPLVRDGWAPAIAGLRASPLAGYTPYDDVVEQLTIEINGATATAALANLAALTKLLDQAARWYRGEAVTAVLIKFAPAGSTVSATATPLQAAILGGGAGSAAGLRLAPQWSDVSFNYVIENVTLTLTRRGLWLLAEETATSASTNNGDQISAVFAAGAQGMPSPTKIAVSEYCYGKNSANRSHGGFLLIGEAVGGTIPFDIENAEGAATGVSFTSVAPAGSTHPRNTNVLRYTPTLTTEVSTLALTPTLPTDTDLVAIFANIRPSATVSFLIRARLLSGLYNQYTPLLSIPANATQYPKWYLLGLVAKYDAITALFLAVTASAASSSMDIDTVVVCDARAVQVLALPGPSDADATSVYVQDVLTIDHKLLTRPSPTVLVANAGYAPFAGDTVFMTKAATIYAVLLATGGGSGTDGDEYRQAAAAGDGLNANVLTATRRPAYVVPQ